MLKSIYVDGFKSLNEFSIDLVPGLTILAGPNGSGKTNILKAVELISQLNRQSLQNLDGYFDTFGSAPLLNVWRKTNSICVKLGGEIKLNQDNVDRISYRLEFALEIQPELTGMLCFSKQLLELEATLLCADKPTSKFGAEYRNGRLKIYDADEAFTSEVFREINADAYFNGKLGKGCFKFNLITRELTGFIKFLPLVLQDFETRGIFEIFPSWVRYKFREPNALKLELYGMGLASTILKLSDGKDRLESGESKDTSFDVKNMESYRQILECVMQHSPELLGLSVEFDEFRKEIDMNVKFENQEKLPIEFMSDGFLKWLSMVVALVTSSGIFLMEEPENFLHPNSQLQFIELTKNLLENRSGLGIISTHSESILSAVDPTDVVATKIQNRQTCAKRIDNSDELKKVFAGERS